MSRFAPSIKRGFRDPASNAMVVAAILPIALIHGSRWLADATGADVPMIAQTFGERALWTSLLAAFAFHAGKDGHARGLQAGWTAAIACAYALLAQAAGSWAESMAHLAAAAAAALGYASGMAYATAMRSRSLLTFAPAILAAGVTAGLAGAPAWNLAARHEAEAVKISAAGNRLLAEYRAISDGGAQPASRAHWEAVNRFSAAILESPFNGDAFVMHRYMDYASFESRQKAIDACRAEAQPAKACLAEAEKIGSEAYRRPASETRFLATAVRIALGRA